MKKHLEMKTNSKITLLTYIVINNYFWLYMVQKKVLAKALTYCHQKLNYFINQYFKNL